jgi:hypothetical protein
MSRKQILLTLILSLGSSGALQANPLDSPGVVYIDGLPCNRACQSYMAWSDQAASVRHRGERETTVVVVPDEIEQRFEHAARPRVARRQPAPVVRPAPRAGIAASNTKASNARKAVAANPAYRPARKNVPAATATVIGEKTVAGGQESEPRVESFDRPEPAQTAAVATSQPPAEAPTSKAPASEVKPEVALPPPATLDIAAAPAAPAPGTASDKAAAASPDDQDNLVALVLTRGEINSLSDLNNKSIAITEKQSASSGRVSAALMAAGAAEVQFSEVKASAIERLINGEVPAAVVLASREVADLFPELEGFRTFRVPLKARL